MSNLAHITRNNNESIFQVEENINPLIETLRIERNILEKIPGARIRVPVDCPASDVDGIIKHICDNNIVGMSRLLQNKTSRLGIGGQSGVGKSTLLKALSSDYEVGKINNIYMAHNLNSSGLEQIGYITGGMLLAESAERRGKIFIHDRAVYNPYFWFWFWEILSRIETERAYSLEGMVAICNEILEKINLNTLKEMEKSFPSIFIVNKNIPEAMDSLINRGLNTRNTSDYHRGHQYCYSFVQFYCYTWIAQKLKSIIIDRSWIPYELSREVFSKLIGMITKPPQEKPQVQMTEYNYIPIGKVTKKYKPFQYLEGKVSPHTYLGYENHNFTYENWMQAPSVFVSLLKNSEPHISIATKEDLEGILQRAYEEFNKDDVNKYVDMMAGCNFMNLKTLP